MVKTESQKVLGANFYVCRSYRGNTGRGGGGGGWFAPPPILNRVKRQKLKSSNHELVDRTIFNWFLNMRSQNVPLSASMIQEKAAIFAKELNTIEGKK